MAPKLMRKGSNMEPKSLPKSARSPLWAPPGCLDTPIVRKRHPREPPDTKLEPKWCKMESWTKNGAKVDPKDTKKKNNIGKNMDPKKKLQPLAFSSANPNKN